MPSYFPENNTPLALDTETRSLQKINALLSVSSSAASVTTFTSVSSAEILASNASRKVVTIFNSTPNTLYVLLGSGTASSSNYSFALGDKELLSLSGITTAIQGIYDTSGTAYVTELT